MRGFLALSYLGQPLSVCAMQYLELDSDQNGMLGLSELRNYNGGSLTEVFCNRVFQECHTYAGEMGELFML
jgi:hypothetical protein